jgi:hypothetical protein
MKFNRQLNRRTVELTKEEIGKFPIGCPSLFLPSKHIFLSNQLNGMLGVTGSNGACNYFRIIEVDKIKKDLTLPAKMLWLSKWRKDQ